MLHSVFAQLPKGPLPIATLKQQARTHTALVIDVSDEAPEASTTCLDVSTPGARGRYRIHSRRVEPADLERARDAERRGRAAGMSGLAERCETLLIVDPDPLTPEWLTWELCALLALTGLGPVLPADGSTLVGVRGARERAERLREGRSGTS